MKNIIFGLNKKAHLPDLYLFKSLMDLSEMGGNFRNIEVYLLMYTKLFHKLPSFCLDSLHFETKLNSYCTKYL